MLIGRTLLLCVGMLLTTTTAHAGKKTLDNRFLYRPFRIGLCAGFSTECLFAAPKIEFATKYVGLNLNVGGFGSLVGLNLKTYPTPSFDVKQTTFRPYAFYGGGVVMMAGGLMGGGIGSDIHFFESKRLLLQPAISVVSEVSRASQIIVGGALGAMAAF